VDDTELRLAALGVSVLPERVRSGRLWYVRGAGVVNPPGPVASSSPSGIDASHSSTGCPPSGIDWSCGVLAPLVALRGVGSPSPLRGVRVRVKG